GDTKLSLNVVQFKNDLKIDLRIIFDERAQRLNQEIDTTVLEASKDDPGLVKFQSDHSKLLVECKLIIDMFLRKGQNIDNVDCIQICGLEIVILNLSLSAPGVYVATERFHSTILNSLSNIDNALDIALHLLSSKNAVIKVNNGYTHQKGVAKDRSTSIKAESTIRLQAKNSRKQLKHDDLEILGLLSEMVIPQAPLHLSI
ncbi:hypothetical protein CU098_011996, partial [Rhizopus stolonifer]